MSQVTEFYQDHKQEILKLVAEEHLNKPTFANMKLEYTSVSGHRYYTYKEKMGMPTVRVVKHGEFMDWFINGISPKDHKLIRQELFECFAHIKAKTKEAQDKTIKAGLLLNELEMRAMNATPLVGLINVAANQLIREDEDPSIFSTAMHEIKCDELMAEIEQGRGDFFFAIPQLRDYWRTPAMSSTELMTLLNKLQTEQIRLNVILEKIIAYTGATKNAMKTPKRPL